MLQLAPIVAVFYAAYFLVTNYIILNLIIGTVLEQFIVRNQEKRKLQRRAAIRTAANLQVPLYAVTEPGTGAWVCLPSSEAMLPS